MNKVFLFLFSIVLISCDKNEISLEFKSKIHPSDAECFKEISKAENDFRKGIDTYCKFHDTLNPSTNNRHNFEFDSIIKSKDIHIKNAYYPHVVYKNKRENCYCEVTNLFFEEKHGKNFIDSIHFISDSLWILKNPDLVFAEGSPNGKWHKPALFPNDKYYNSEYHTGLQDQFDSLYMYGKDYIKTDNGDGVSQIRVDVFVDKQGKATYKNHYVTFFNFKLGNEKYNKKYEESIKDLAIRLITENTWIPATIGNIDVNSELSVIIKLK